MRKTVVSDAAPLPGGRDRGGLGRGAAAASYEQQEKKQKTLKQPHPPDHYAEVRKAAMLVEVECCYLCDESASEVQQMAPSNLPSRRKAPSRTLPPLQPPLPPPSYSLFGRMSRSPNAARRRPARRVLWTSQHRRCSRWRRPTSHPDAKPPPAPSRPYSPPSRHPLIPFLVG